jgi:hypothetical protein
VLLFRKEFDLRLLLMQTPDPGMVATVYWLRVFSGFHQSI